MKSNDVVNRQMRATVCVARLCGTPMRTKSSVSILKLGGLDRTHHWEQVLIEEWDEEPDQALLDWGHPLKWCDPRVLPTQVDASSHRCSHTCG